jgi:mannose-1-phosphate guanylyltransferase
MTHTADDLAQTTAVILAGGVATAPRFPRGPGDDAPGRAVRRPFVAHVLDRVAAAGIGSAVVCAEASDELRTALGEHHKTVRLAHARVAAPFGTATALRLALPLCDADPVLVLNGDSVCRVDLRAVWRWHFTRGADATIVLSRTPDTRRHGRVLVGRSFRIFGFQDKPETPSPGWINAGVYVLGRQLLSAMPADASSLEHDVLPTWIPQSLHGFPTAAPLLDAGTPETLARAPHGGAKAASPAT